MVSDPVGVVPNGHKGRREGAGRRGFSDPSACEGRGLLFCAVGVAEEDLGSKQEQETAHEGTAANDSGLKPGCPGCRGGCQVSVMFAAFQG